MKTFFLFEVMDKMLPLEFIWLFFPIAGIIGFLLALKRPALLVLYLFLVIPLFILVGFLHISEINDPLIGKHVIREAGFSYVAQSYIAIFIGTVLPFLGLLARFWRRSTTAVM